MSRGTLLAWVISLAVAFALGMAASRFRSIVFHTAGITDGDPDHIHAYEEKSYVCPMHPQVSSDEPGACPICGMALTPRQQIGVEADADEGAKPTVYITPAVINNLGVKTAPVTRTTLVRHIETPGFVQQIEPTGHTRVIAPFEARIVALHFKPGQWLEQGSPLVTLESEALHAAEQSHVALLEENREAGPTLQNSPSTAQDNALAESRERLTRLGLSSEDIRQLEQKRAPSSQLMLRAPYSSMATKLQVAEGDSVASGAGLFELSGLARASVLANAFQRDAAWIQAGQPIEVRLPHVSGEVWSGVVNQAAVSIDPSSQNIGVRLSFTAPAQLLKNAMYVVATIHGDVRTDVLAAPQEALISTESENRMIVALGQGRFKPVRVQTGIETDGQVEILSGLEEGAEVVVSSQFLIDSESSLQASFLRMMEH